MKHIDIWTDGSYKAKKGGCSFYISAPEILEKPILVYSFVKAKKSTQVELLSIINAIKYLYYLKIDLKDCHIKIMCDESSIVEAFNNKRYRVWEEKDWRKKNGKPIKSSFHEWFQLTCLVESIPEDNIEFIKVPSQKDKGNKIVDKYSNYARNLETLREGYFTILEYFDDKNEFIEKEVVDSIDSSASKKILNRKNPWDKNYSTKRIKWKYSPDDVILIDCKDIDIVEEVHLNCKEITFGKLLKQIIERRQIKFPIAVRKVDERYVLIAGIARLTAAKLLNLQKVPCVILDLNHDEFIKENTKIVERK